MLILKTNLPVQVEMKSTYTMYKKSIMHLPMNTNLIGYGEMKDQWNLSLKIINFTFKQVFDF